MDRRLLVLVVAVVALIGVVNATAFAYRWMTGTVDISGPSGVTGAACTGFYSIVDQPDISGYLPRAGSNAGAPTYGGNSITVEPSNPVCQWTNETSNNPVQLYESIDVSIPITVGSWYIQDFYGFGYYSGRVPVYVWFRLEDDATDGGYLTTAKLVIYKVDSSGTVTYVTELDLLGSSGTYVSAGSLNPGEAFRLDLRFDAYSAGTVSFKVGVYVSQENEAPVSPTP
ncbi:MAG: hypothetical protein ACPLQS_07565 [Desulfurococcaceae archaeon]